MRANIELMKNDIKELVTKQIDAKEQRKEKRFTGTRTMSAWEAAMVARIGRDKLRQHYKAYAMLRGQEPDAHACIKTDEPYDEKHKVDSLLEKYKDEEALRSAA